MRTSLLMVLLGICLISWAQNPEVIHPQIQGFQSEKSNPDFSSELPGQNNLSIVNSNLAIEESKNSYSPADNFTPQQVISIPQGWSGISGFIIPDNPNIEFLMKPLMDRFVILNNQNGMYYPDQNINTLVNWNPQSGYVAKFSQPASMGLSGQVNTNRTITLNAGWNLIPVLSNCPVNVAEFFQNQDMVVVKDVATYKLYWPSMGINTLNELLPGKAYYVLMAATATLTFPDIQTFQWQCGEPFVDPRDSRVYNTVQIGTQCWMAENLNVGTMVNGASNQTNNGLIEKYCYNNAESNCNTYGGLYQWDEMMQYSTTPGLMGICPNGWHLPTDSDWTTMITYISSQSEYLCNSNSSYIAKSIASTLNWSAYNGICTVGNNQVSNNSTGFSGLPGGYRNDNGTFLFQESHTGWWTSNQLGFNNAYHRNIDYGKAFVYSFESLHKIYGYSVRCLKDDNTSLQFEINPVYQVVLATNGTTTFNVNSNTEWTVSENDEWLSIDPISSNNNDLITVNYDANLNDEFRIGEITVTTSSGEPSIIVTLLQHGQQTMVCGQPIIDSRDSKTYNTVLIGNQCWMAQNLNVGSMISGSVNQENNDTIEKYCYNNNEDQCNVYGGLYQWNEMMNYSTDAGVQGICMTGWHLPTEAEWNKLTNFISSQSAYLCNSDSRYIAKAIASTSNWSTHNGTCTVGNNQASNNSTGFSGLPGGYRNDNGTFLFQESHAGWWTSNQFDFNNAYHRNLTNSFPIVYSFESLYKINGYSVRCLKDDPSPLQLSVSPSNQNETSEAGTTTFNILSNTSWTVNEDNSWISASTMIGSGNEILTVTYDANTESTPRIGEITIAAAGANAVVVTVSQAGWSCGNSFTDTRDGKNYTTVQIGAQCWMAQNLNVGTRIDGIVTQTNNGIVEKYCYNNYESKCDVYGGLYQWNELMQYSSNQSIQGICPQGWHIPSDAEWTTMLNLISSNPAYCCNNNSSFIAKSLASFNGWSTSSNICAVGNNQSINNSSSFSAIPSGLYYKSSTSFINQTFRAYFWTSTEFGSQSNARRIYLSYSEGDLDRSFTSSSNGLPVRCIKDN